jgi:hypothetical protein
MDTDVKNRLERSLRILKSKGLLTEYVKKKIFGEGYEDDEEAMELLAQAMELLAQMEE